MNPERWKGGRFVGARDFRASWFAGEFYAQGNKRSSQMPEYLREYGLDTFEYSGGHGLRMSEKTAPGDRESGPKAGVLSIVHAPYFINLANEDSEKIINSHRYA